MGGQEGAHFVQKWLCVGTQRTITGTRFERRIEWLLRWNWLFWAVDLGRSQIVGSWDFEKLLNFLGQLDKTQRHFGWFLQLLLGARDKKTYDEPTTLRRTHHLCVCSRVWSQFKNTPHIVFISNFVSPRHLHHGLFLPNHVHREINITLLISFWIHN